MTLQVSVEEQGDEVVATLAGEMDTRTAGRFGTTVEPFLGRANPRLVVDVDALRFLDSSGISELLRVRQRTADAGGSFRIRQASPAVRRVIEITGLLEVLGLD